MLRRSILRLHSTTATSLILLRFYEQWSESIQGLIHIRVWIVNSPTMLEHSLNFEQIKCKSGQMVIDALKNSTIINCTRLRRLRNHFIFVCLSLVNETLYSTVQSKSTSPNTPANFTTLNTCKNKAS